MPSATLTVRSKADVVRTFTLISQTAKGALYKDVTRSLSLPNSIEFNYNVGAPGAKGNDRLSIVERDTVVDANGSVATATMTVSISIPRNSAWTTALSEDMLCHLQDMTSDAKVEKYIQTVVP